MPGIRADLVRLDDDWQDWGFTQLVEALRKWTERNPKIFVPPDKNLKRDKMCHTRENEHKSRICVYCDEEVAKVSDCWLILSQKRLCFNCTGSKHRASECRSTKTCLTCKDKHHTSIYENGSNMLLTTNTSLVTYPVLVIEVEGVKCRALIDTGAGSSYASSKLINKINKKPIRRETKRIETQMHSVVKKAEIYQFKIGDINQEFKIGIEINKLEKEVLLELPNPNYPEIHDTGTKKELPVYVILGAGGYTKIKTQERARAGQPGEPIAELAKQRER